VGLKHLKIAVETIESSAGDFTVRGLNLDDIVAIVNAYRPELTELFGQIQSDGENFSLADPTTLAESLGKAAPGSVAMIIAYGADEKDVDLVRAIPFPAQLEALEKIGKLTFATEGGPKKVVEIIIRILKGAMQTVADLKA
jgi:hypothetical protein